MLKIRLQRVGRKHDPAFRVVVTESTQGPKTGKHVERLGYYHAKTGERSFNADRIKYWIGNGAQVSDTVRNFLIGAKIIDGKKVNVLPKRKPVKAKKEETVTPAATPGAEDTDDTKTEEQKNDTPTDTEAKAEDESKDDKPELEPEQEKDEVEEKKEEQEGGGTKEEKVQ